MQLLFYVVTIVTPEKKRKCITLQLLYFTYVYIILQIQSFLPVIPDICCRLYDAVFWRQYDSLLLTQNSLANFCFITENMTKQNVSFKYNYSPIV